MLIFSIWITLEIQPKAIPICLSRAPRKRKVGSIEIYPWKEVFKLLGLTSILVINKVFATLI